MVEEVPEKSNAVAEPTTTAPDRPNRIRRVPVREIVHAFRVSRGEDEIMKSLIQYAFLKEQISRPVLSEYINFCLNAGREKLDRIYHKGQ